MTRGIDFYQPMSLDTIADSKLVQIPRGPRVAATDSQAGGGRPVMLI